MTDQHRALASAAKALIDVMTDSISIYGADTIMLHVRTSRENGILKATAEAWYAGRHFSVTTES
jgi:hypothetical protein